MSVSWFANQEKLEPGGDKMAAGIFATKFDEKSQIKKIRKQQSVQAKKKFLKMFLKRLWYPRIHSISNTPGKISLQ